MINSEVKNRKLIWFKALHIALANFMFGYTLSVFNPCIENISYSLSWSDSDSKLYSNIFSSIIPVGALFEASVTSSFCGRFGRKPTLMIIDVIMILGSGLCVVPSTAPFGIGRFIVGFGVGMCLAIAPMYIGESTPQEMMGSIGPCMSLMGASGVTISYAFGLVLPTSNFDSDLNSFWQFMMAFPGIIASYQLFIVCAFFKYDSPVYYLQTGNTVKYKAVLTSNYDLEDIENELSKPKEEKTNSNIKISDDVSLKQVLCNKTYRKMTRIGATIATFQQFSGINAIIFYSSSIFQDIGISISISRLITFFIGVSMIISSILTMYLLGRLGRKLSLVSGHILISIDLLIIGLLAQFLPAATTALAICVCVYFVLFTYALQATLWSYIGEIQNKIAITFTTMLNFIANVIVLVVFPYAVDSVGVPATFYFFCVCMAVGSIYCIVDVFETKNKTTSEIELEIFKVELQ